MERKKYIEGLILGALAFIMWGLLPLYWKTVKALDAYQVFAHRVFWSVGFLFFVIYMKKDLKQLTKLIVTPKAWKKVLLPACFISVNWLTYIWSVNNGYVIEASLGYFLNPLVLTLFGMMFFKEKLDKLQLMGIGLAAIGVFIKIFVYGKIPFLALILAFSFAIYGLLKKQSPYDAITGLSLETVLISIPATGYILFFETSGQGITGNLPIYFWLIIALSGALTAIPLLLYGASTRRLPLKIVGFLQYVAPTISLMLGIFVFKEPFQMQELVPFLVIWLGLLFFVVSQVRLLKQK